MSRSSGPHAGGKRKRVDLKWEAVETRHCHYPVGKRCCRGHCSQMFSPEHVSLLREALLRSGNDGEYIQQRIKTERPARRAVGGPNVDSSLSEESSEDDSSGGLPASAMKSIFRCDEFVSLLK
jgi:hypothetical protein